MNRIVFTLCSILALVTGCSLLDDGNHPSIDELGATQTSYTLGYAEGEFTITVYANKAGKVVVPDDVDWLAVPEPDFNGDASIAVRYLANEGEARTATILLKTETREEPISVNQSAKP